MPQTGPPKNIIRAAKLKIKRFNSSIKYLKFVKYEIMEKMETMKKIYFYCFLFSFLFGLVVLFVLFVLFVLVPFFKPAEALYFFLAMIFLGATAGTDAVL